MKKFLILIFFGLLLIPSAHASSKYHQSHWGYHKKVYGDYHYRHFGHPHSRSGKLTRKLKYIKYEIDELEERKYRLKERIAKARYKNRYHQEKRLERRLCQVEERISRLEGEKYRIKGKVRSHKYRYGHRPHRGYVAYHKHGHRDGLFFGFGF